MVRATWFALAVVLCLSAAARAQTPAFSRLTLAELDCAHCAKAVGKHVAAVPGVAEVRYDLKTKALFAIHRAGATPSPRALWEAVERGEHEVRRLDTPSGTHTAKPDA